MYPQPSAPPIASEGPWNASTTGAFSNYIASAPPGTPPEAIPAVTASSSRSRVSTRGGQSYAKCVVCYHDVYPADATLPRPCLHGPLHASCLISEERLALSAADATCRSPALRCIVCHSEIASIAFNLSAESPSIRLPFQPHPDHKHAPPISPVPLPPQAFAPPVGPNARHPRPSGIRGNTVHLGHDTTLDARTEENSNVEKDSPHIRVDLHVFHHHHHHHHHQRRRSGHVNRHLNAGSTSRKNREGDRGSRRVVSTGRARNCPAHRRSSPPRFRSRSRSQSQSRSQSHSQSHDLSHARSRSGPGSPSANRRLSCGARWTASIKRR